MKKFLTYSGLTVAILALAAYFGVTYFLGSIIKAGVNRIGPRLTQTRVVLDSAVISPLTGSGTLAGLTVDNPRGWTEGRAFYLGRMRVAMKPLSLMGDHVIINDIEIDQAEFAYETTIISSNINDLLKNIEAARGGSAEKSETNPNAKPMKIEIRHFRLTNAKVTIGVGATAVPLTMPTIELHDLGTAEGGLTPSQLAFAVMKSLSSGVVSAATRSPGSLMSGAAIESVKKTGQEIKKLFGTGK